MPYNHVWRKLIFRVYRLSAIQTSLLGYRDQLEFLIFLYNKYRPYYCTLKGVNSNGVYKAAQILGSINTFILLVCGIGFLLIWLSQS